MEGGRGDPGTCRLTVNSCAGPSRVRTLISRRLLLTPSHSVNTAWRAVCIYLQGKLSKPKSWIMCYTLANSLHWRCQLTLPPAMKTNSLPTHSWSEAFVLFVHIVGRSDVIYCSCSNNADTEFVLLIVFNYRKTSKGGRALCYPVSRHFFGARAKSSLLLQHCDCTAVQVMCHHSLTQAQLHQATQPLRNSHLDVPSCMAADERPFPIPALFPR